LVRIIGASKAWIPILFDLCSETLKIKRFEIFKNLVDDIEPQILNFKNQYTWTFIDSSNKINLDGTLIFGITSPYGKKEVFNYFSEKKNLEKESLSTLIHPTSYIASSVKISNGCILEPLANVSSQTTLGFGVTLKRGVSIGHHNLIDDYCEINPGVVTSGYVTIGKETTIGSGVVISNNIKIGSKVLIGAGSVVISDIPDNVIAYGNPCRVLKENDKWKR